MSDTPRTDAEIDRTLNPFFLDVEFSRALERKNAALREALEELTSRCEQEVLPTPRLLAGMKAARLLLPPPSQDSMPGSFNRKDTAAPSPDVAELDAQPFGWIPCSERMPQLGTRCFVWAREAWRGEEFGASIDTWREQHEAPLMQFPSATIPIGPGWDDHDTPEVSHWMPVEAPRAESHQGTRNDQPRSDQ